MDRSEVIEDAKAALAGWRDISCAPDQKWIMGWSPDHGCLVVKRVEPNGTAGDHGPFVWATPENGSDGFWAEDLITHWQPLPPPPSA